MCRSRQSVDWLSWVTDVTTLQGDWTGFLSLVSAVLLSTFILLLPSSSVSLSNFYLALPMRGCLGKHSCMSSPFPIAILNWTCSLRALILFCGDVPAIKTKLSKQTNQLLSCWVDPAACALIQHWHSNCKLQVDGDEGTQRPVLYWCKKVRGAWLAWSYCMGFQNFVVSNKIYKKKSPVCGASQVGNRGAERNKYSTIFCTF